jgi:hypothetical protein
MRPRVSRVLKIDTAGRLAPRDGKPVLRYPHEKILARETGTILVFMVGLCRGRPNQLDWRTQLLCTKQSS